MDKNPYKVLQSLLPGISRLEAKSLCLLLAYQPNNKLTLPTGIILSFKTVSQNDSTLDSTSILRNIPTQKSLESNTTKQ